MAYKCTLNKINTYTLKDGFTLKKQFNEDLDSGLISFQVFGTSADIEPFDEIEIFETNNKITRKKFLVDSPEERIFSFGNSFANSDKIYNVPLFSETKVLERRTLPNCSVTQPIQEGMTIKTVWDEIQRFCNQYLKKIRVYDSVNGYKWVNEFVLDSALETRFGAITCPEFQWNKPTLREVLDDLMSTDDCIALVRNNVLTFFDLKTRGSQINLSYIHESIKTQSSADYCSDLTMSVTNGVGKSRTIVCEKKSFTTDETEMTTNNMAVITQHPIYNIISCKISYFYSCLLAQRSGAREGYEQTDNIVYFKDVDVTKFVVEKDIYDLASNGNYPDYSLIEPEVHPYNADQEEILKHKQYLVYYKRGSNKIEGWGIPARFGGSSSGTRPHVGQMVEAINKGSLWTSSYSTQYAFAGVNQRDIREITVDLVYETLTDKAMNVGRYLPLRNGHNQIFDNQSSSYVDIMHQSIFEYAKVNRLGNKIREIHGVYFNESDIPELGDLIGNEVLFCEEITYYDDKFEFTGYLTENYILRNYFTGIQAKRRSWQIAKDEDAFTRQDIFKNYLEFSFKQKIERAFATNTIEVMKFADALKNYSAGTAIKYGLMQSFAQPVEENDQITYSLRYPEESDCAYQLDITAEVQGLSLAFEFSTRDNIVVDYFIEMDGNHYMSDFYKYCDNYGEFAAMYVALASYVNPSDNEFEWVEQPLITNNYKEYNENASNFLLVTNDNNNAIQQKMNEKSRAKPLIKIGNPISASVVTVQGQRFLSDYIKDNREIIKTTLQYEYCSDTADILVTPEFIKRCSCYNDSANSVANIKVYASTTETYNLSDLKAKGTINNSLSPDVDIYNNSLMISCLGLTREMNVASYCYADANGNILLAVNLKDRPYQANVFLNFLYSRDANIYANAIDRYVVGTLASYTAESLNSSYTSLVNNGNISYNSNSARLRDISRRELSSSDLSDILSGGE